MRSNLVFDAMKHVSNRYLLSQLVAKATRELHKPGTRMQDTTNDVLVRCSRSSPLTLPMADRNSAIAAVSSSGSSTGPRQVDERVRNAA
jgi:hypothetical protein